ncbi:TusA-related sulfurtransferase [Halomonas sp. HL-93]|nr:MAG: putative redox protein, regulator of disulfide bond formation [Halomonas sp. HL-93]SBR46383.1 TusA-related sulfurtransferase [Halomonas sp. HL-93]SNY98729.1 TusA-related sulfurtransferase [Halomonas sp. hl-4]
MEQTTRLQPDTVLDACGLHCPLPLLKAKQALAGLAPGQLLEVRATDAGSWRDIEAFAQQSSHCLEAREQHGDIYYYWLRKAEGEHS